MKKKNNERTNFDFLYLFALMAMCFPMGQIPPQTIINIYTNKSEVKIENE